MNNQVVTLSPDLYFSYNQFFVYDKELGNGASEWNEVHSRQGFARREQAIAMGTLCEYGTAKVSVHLTHFATPNKYERVIAVPLLTKSGSISVDGPEEYPLERSCPVANGHYRVVIAQHVTGENSENIDIFLEKLEKSKETSEIIVADESLNPSDKLLETAEIIKV